MSVVWSTSTAPVRIPAESRRAARASPRVRPSSFADAEGHHVGLPRPHRRGRCRRPPFNCHPLPTPFDAVRLCRPTTSCPARRRCRAIGCTHRCPFPEMRPCSYRAMSCHSARVTLLREPTRFLTSGDRLAVNHLEPRMGAAHTSPDIAPWCRGARPPTRPDVVCCSRRPAKAQAVTLGEDARPCGFTWARKHAPTPVLAPALGRGRGS
jgi:hypothetical protein